jgi:hypothetical protein
MAVFRDALLANDVVCDAVPDETDSRRPSRSACITFRSQPI